MPSEGNYYKDQGSNIRRYSVWFRAQSDRSPKNPDCGLTKSMSTAKILATCAVHLNSSANLLNESTRFITTDGSITEEGELLKACRLKADCVVAKVFGCTKIFDDI